METSRKRRLPKPSVKMKVRSISAANQLKDMAAKHPEFFGRRLGNQATWDGRFQPTPACAVYLVRIEALAGQRPWVSVLEPELRIAGDRWLETPLRWHSTIPITFRHTALPVTAPAAKAIPNSYRTHIQQTAHVGFKSRHHILGTSRDFSATYLPAAGST